MTGIINKAARQIDMRGRDASGIVSRTLNPGFNIVDDDTWAILMKNKHNSILVDEGVIVAGTKRTREEEEFERQVRESNDRADENALKVPAAAAGLTKSAPTSKDPNVDLNGINPQTGKKYTNKEKRELQASDDSLSLE